MANGMGRLDRVYVGLQDPLVERLVQIVEMMGAGLARAIPYAPISEHMFLQHALLGLVVLSPLCAMIGIQVVNFRLAFFSEAVGHSVFTGIALGSVLNVLLSSTTDTTRELVMQLSMIGFAILVATGITAYRRATNLSSDTIIGIFSATIVALGLAVIAFLINTGRVPPQGIYQTLLAGNILTISPAELVGLIAFFIVALTVEFFAYNRLMFIGLNPELAETRGINVALYEYLFSVLLAVVVMFSIQWVGVLLVTALLVIPAASARNFARTAGAVFWIAVVISLVTSVSGLVLSDIFSTTTGATVILSMTTVFLLSTVYRQARGG